MGQTKKSKEALPLAGNDTCAKIAAAIGYFNKMYINLAMTYYKMLEFFKVSCESKSRNQAVKDK
ncbi:MAG: hypothetical protein LBP36_04225 [Oscillospiraceae bacterium]|nr:hypothetical protein [Oscillospiraceae bacterium]